jgi:hypothetical protein
MRHTRPKKRSNNTNRFIGVAYSKSKRKWQAYLKVNGKVIDLGRFDSVEEAARARDDAAVKRHRNPVLNFPVS